jgi:hypothetical protein
MTEYKFIINKPVEVEETRYYEFKEITGGKPLNTIKNTCDEYVVAFLNSAGGRIFWGIRDSDRYAVGVPLSFTEREDLRKTVTGKLNEIKPPISPTAYQINLHSVYEDETCNKTIEDRYVVEIVAPRVFGNDLYSTGSGEVYVRTDSGKRKLNFQEIQDEIRRRQILKVQDSIESIKLQESSESQSAFLISLLFSSDGIILKDEAEFRALLAEALYASENKQDIKFDLRFEPIEILKRGIAALDNGVISPDERLDKIRLLRLLKNYEQRLNNLKETLPLLFQTPIRDFFVWSTEIAESVKGLGLLALIDEDSVSCAVQLDIFRRDEPKINAVIGLNDEETEQLKNKLDLKSLSQLLGFGYDLIDLPKTIRLNKAIPAMLLETNRVKKKVESNSKVENTLDLREMLNYNKWHVGLH